MIYARAQINNKIINGVVDEKQENITVIDGSFYNSFKLTNEIYSLKDVKLIVPCSPSKITAVGLNYSDHAKEMNLDIPKEPVIFIKPATTVIGQNDFIIYPKQSDQVDYEAELGIVIKKETKNIKLEDVNEYILGYTCVNDVTARDLQKKDGQWSRAKSFDTFCPIGPWIVSDINPDNLNIKLFLNGVLKQNSSTKNLIFKTNFLVHFLSNIMTLLPGDVIITGTPSGIGSMKIGDKVEVNIEQIGSLISFVKEV
jgi:2-keto-4-pentenoate hydratase/2-oxohepta-3-ene-1,7-dioic acid hydratase in catechol pathway